MNPKHLIGRLQRLVGWLLFAAGWSLARLASRRLLKQSAIENGTVTTRSIRAGTITYDKLLGPEL